MVKRLALTMLLGAVYGTFVFTFGYVTAIRDMAPGYDACLAGLAHANDLMGELHDSQHAERVPMSEGP